MKKVWFIVLGIVVVIIAGIYVLNSYIYNEKQAIVAVDYKEAAYIIEGEQVEIARGVQYFGNELWTDLDNDGREDVVFLITHQPGGSGTFYYAVAAINTGDGYVGSDGYLLGDRIAPQTIEVSGNPRHKNVIVVNYADRAESEPMTAPPSVGKSAYIKLDPDAMQWGVVEPNFEGESANGTGVLSVIELTMGKETYVGKTVSVRGRAHVNVFYSERPCEANDPCDTAMGAQLELWHDPLVAGAENVIFASTPCVKSAVGVYTCGPYSSARDEVVTMTGVWKKEKVATGFMGSSNGQEPKPIQWSDKYFLEVK